MRSRKIFVLAFAVVYTAITGCYSASQWLDSRAPQEYFYLVLFTFVVLTASISVYLINKNQLVQCFLVSSASLSFLYASTAVLSQDYAGLLLPALVAVMFLLLPRTKHWIEEGLEPNED